MRISDCSSDVCSSDLTSSAIDQKLSPAFTTLVPSIDVDGSSPIVPGVAGPEGVSSSLSREVVVVVSGTVVVVDGAEVVVASVVVVASLGASEVVVASVLGVAVVAVVAVAGSTRPTSRAGTTSSREVRKSTRLNSR